MISSLDFKIDDNDFVFVDIDDGNELCNESFDYCDDGSNELSQSPSSLESVCSESMFTQCYFEATLEKLNGMTSSMTSMEEDIIKKKNDDEIDSVASLEEEKEEEQSMKESSQKVIEINQNKTKITRASMAKHSPENLLMSTGKNQMVGPVKYMSGSRMSNKKRRKKMKLLKKARATAAALSESQNTITHISTADTTSSSPRKQRRMGFQVGRIARRSTNAAVACVAQSLIAYRKEHNILAKKTTHSLNYVC